MHKVQQDKVSVYYLVLFCEIEDHDAPQDRVVPCRRSLINIKGVVSLLNIVLVGTNQ